MVCIPCIVIPVLLWVYKRFLEPYIYPIISPIIRRFWNNAAVDQTAANTTDKHKTAECNGTANGSTANGPKTVADKKAD
ncbi:UPF0729 protein C18orf32 homolog [Triplophysa rosa]|uniref:UPF0729 protein C18orf32-like protein n=1 Tax=Triplophysa rosa TaxID=992332 RepID=A0A9W7TG13_TRIRA|nr:UPF0729 protein C18orf32 homolog [Triplophysa rosa]KAI7796259.1 UPF0729 protein C18orf32-like protein [Triplophysa rosa]